MAQDSKAHETPEEFMKDIRDTYGDKTWSVIRKFILCDKQHVVDGGSGTMRDVACSKDEEMNRLFAIIDGSDVETDLDTDDFEAMVCPLTERVLHSSDSYETL